YYYQFAAPSPRARPLSAARSAANDAGRNQAVGLQRNDGFAKAPLRRAPRTGLLFRTKRPGPLPCQRFQPARRDFGCIPRNSIRDQVFQSIGSAGGGVETLR